MANLSSQQAAALIKAPKNKKDILKARQKRIRNRLHAQTDVKLPGFSFLYETHHKYFLDWVDTIIEDKESLKQYKRFYNPPIPTNELAESIFSKHARVFEAQDRNIDINFDNPNLAADAMGYLKEIGDPVFWKTEGFDQYKNSIDNVLVIDLPTEPGQSIDPYYYFVDIDHIIDIENTKVLFNARDDDEHFIFKTEYLIFKRDDKIIVIDDTFYRVYLNEENKEPVLETETEHFLGYAPARSFWTTPLHDDTTFLKKNQFISSLSELDWLLFWELSKKYLDMYAPFPIYAVYRAKCNYRDTENNVSCVGGYLNYKDSHGNTTRKKCPKCSNGIKKGPGRVMEFGAPQEKDDPDLLRNPVKVIGAEKSSLEYVQDEVMRLESEIYRNTVGTEQEQDDTQAKNEDQISKGFESELSVLRGIAKNFEIIQTWAYETIFKLRYGSEVEMKIHVYYGENFFRTTKQDLVNELKKAKDAGLTAWEIHGKKMSMYEDIYKGNPDKFARMKILSELDPFPESDLEEVLKWRKEGAFISELDIIKKTYFTKLIQRFEREQTDIGAFANLLEYNKRIAAINQVLDEYAAEIMGANGGGASGEGGAGEREDIEAEAKARLKGSVGGVQGLIAIQQSVASGITSREAAIAIMDEIFGFDEATATRMLSADPAQLS